MKTIIFDATLFFLKTIGIHTLPPSFLFSDFGLERSNQPINGKF